MRSLLYLGSAAWALAACGPGATLAPAVTDPVVTAVVGALSPGTAVVGEMMSTTSAPVALAALSGELAVATADTVLTRSAASGALAPLPVGAVGEVMSTGAVRFVWHRGTDSLWVVAENGLFHASNHRLLRAPLSDDLAGLTVRAIDGYGEGSGEEVWLTTSGGLRRVASGQMRSVEVAFPRLGALGIPTVAIAAGAGQAVVVANQQVFFIDVLADTATWIAKDVGTLKAWTRTDDGSVMLATDTGLYERARSGEVKRRTLAAAGQPVVVASDVANALGTVLICAGGKVARLEGAAFKTFGDVVAPAARGVQLDAAGDTFVLDGASLLKLATGKPVSFATEVKPFFAAHCNGCHLTGSQGSPTIDFTDFATAKSFSALVVRRLKAEGVAPMPPAATEALAAADYAVVLKWVAGGTQP